MGSQDADKTRLRQGGVKRAISSTAYSRRDTYTDTDKKTQRATSTADKDRGQLAPHTRGEQAVTRCTE